MSEAPHPLGRIGQLAENLRTSARSVVDAMHLSPGGDAYEYRGSTNDVDELINALNEIKHFTAGWIR